MATAHLMKDLSDRTRRAAAELWALQEIFIKAVSQRSPEQPVGGHITGIVDDDALQDLKAAADHLRHLLWAYMDEARKMRGIDPDDVLFAYRVRRISEMLRIVSPQLASPDRPLSQANLEVLQGTYSILSEMFDDKRRESSDQPSR